jgi:hypothetical protein
MSRAGSAKRPGAGRQALALARRGIAFEVGIWGSLARWVARRPAGVRAGAQPFGYARTVTPLIWLFIVVSAIEVPVAHVLLPWHVAQAASLVIGVWGLLWMLGLLASLHVYPHLVTDDGLRVRYGAHLDVHVPWAAVRSVSAHRRDLPSQRSVQVVETTGGAVLHAVVASQTSVDVVLDEPLTVDLPRGRGTVTQVRLHADDPRALVSAARTHLAAGDRGPSPRRAPRP